METLRCRLHKRSIYRRVAWDIYTISAVKFAGVSREDEDL